MTLRGTRLVIKADTLQTLRGLRRFAEAEGATIALMSENRLCMSVEGLNDAAAAKLAELGATKVRPEYQYHLDVPPGISVEDDAC